MNRAALKTRLDRLKTCFRWYSVFPHSVFTWSFDESKKNSPHLPHSPERFLAPSVSFWMANFGFGNRSRTPVRARTVRELVRRSNEGEVWSIHLDWRAKGLVPVFDRVMSCPMFYCTLEGPGLLYLYNCTL